MVNSARVGRRRLLLPSLLALAGLGVLIGLGTWQLERKAWKEELIAALSARLAAPPGNLPPREQWDRLDRAGMEFRRVSFAAEFVSGQEALVYATGSALRPDATGPGYWIFAPARLPGGSVVVVNRGFVPMGELDRAAPPLPGLIDITGALRWPEPGGLFTPNDEPEKNLWFVRDPRAIAAAKGWEEVAPFYVEQEAPAAAGGLPRVGRLQPNLPNNHLQYALTWYALAATLVVILVLWLRRESPRTGSAL
jgi:surfeit locus 1 family protein